MKKKRAKGITIVSPMYGDRDKTDRMVLSIVTQFISPKNPFKIHLVLVDDYIEKRGQNNESYYNYYLSDDFKQFYNDKQIKIEIIKNETHKYQGEGREIGFMAGDYDFFLLIDCDDMLAPNACDRYLDAINSFYDNPDNSGKNIACIQGLLYGFDTNGYEQLIKGDSIWVQSRCYNRNFIVDNDIHFPTGTNSKCGEDYPFIRKLDYAINHDDRYEVIMFNFQNVDNPVQCSAYWFPNEDSLSRKDPHYGQHLSGWTMNSSLDIYKYFQSYNKKHNIEDVSDEFMKHEILNMNIYAFYNLLDFVKEIATTDYEPIEEDWYALRNAVIELRDILKSIYWDELIYSDIEDTLYNVKHFSDVRFTESWIGNFYDYINKDCALLSMEYEDVMKYAKSLKFDAAGHELNAPYVKAWEKRHS